MITLMSWGFKFGRPEANLIMDVSFLKNPWREGVIGKQDIMTFMMKQEGFADLTTLFTVLLAKYDELYPKENITVAFCCSAGEYRSPAVVERVSELLREEKIMHRVIQSPNSKL